MWQFRYFNGPKIFEHLLLLPPSWAGKLKKCSPTPFYSESSAFLRNVGKTCQTILPLQIKVSITSYTLRRISWQHVDHLGLCMVQIRRLSPVTQSLFVFLRCLCLSPCKYRPVFRKIIVSSSSGSSSCSCSAALPWKSRHFNTSKCQ